ncbi:unannotated protein [freshwater metagenome]|uniref:Unannotated protein n=1 Tax=freshwater metagenome TaxID=449393 RepID=A0A6J6HAW0_9ZZZZ|nr:hypothetical protein [Actinomycetota bacterium]
MNQNMSWPVRTGHLAAGGSLLIGGAGAALLVAPSAGATAATFTVLNTDDAGAGSLRQALLDANTNSGADVVVFAAGVTGTITLTTGQLEVTDSVIVTGPGSANLSVTAPTGQIFYLYKQGVSKDISISGLTLTGGATPVHSWSTNLVLDDIVASGSTAGPNIDLSSYDSGLDQSLIVRNSVITGASISSNGAGILVGLGFGSHTVEIDNTEITNNAGSSTGGLRVEEASSVVITDSVISGNTSTSGNGGGAFFATSVGDVQIISTTVDGNTSGNWGGGLYFLNDSVEVLDSTISNNTAISGGGGINFNDVFQVASISNTTITGNSANYGGGIMVQGVASLTINQSTITENTSTSNFYDGGGIALYSSVSLALSGTIISGNSSVNVLSSDIEVKDSSPITINADHSMFGVGTVDTDVTLNGVGNVRSDSPGLGVLVDNGGLTKTMALLTGSPAIDAGPDPVATFDGNGFDQRGTPFLRVYGGRADIGAFESQPIPEPTTTTTTTTAAPGTDPVVPTFAG